MGAQEAREVARGWRTLPRPLQQLVFECTSRGTLNGLAWDPSHPLGRLATSTVAAAKLRWDRIHPNTAVYMYCV